MKKLILLMAGLSVLSACTRKASPPQAPKILSLAIWSNYISQATLDEFKARTGTEVIVSNYSSNEELLAKLQAGASGYDVAVPSDYMVFAMIQLGLLEKVDATKISVPKSFAPLLSRPAYDPEHQYSMPFDWGTTGIAVRRDLYEGKILGWKDLFNDPKLKGKFSLLDDARESLGAALKSLGFALNSQNSGEINQARDVLKKIRKSVKEFTSEPKSALLSGELVAAHIYSSDALQAGRETQGKVEYIVPAEGATLWVDNLVIPKGAKNREAAHQFISYLLEAKTSSRTVEAIMVGPSNLDALPLLAAGLRENPGLFPSAQVMGRLEMMKDMGDQSGLYDRAWTEVKAH
jgi:spermidine/putrescine transport system substrate-binding protein